MAGDNNEIKIGSIYNKNVQFVNSGYKSIVNNYGYSGDSVSGLTYEFPYSGLIVHDASGMSMPKSGRIFLASLNASNQNFSGMNYVSGMSRYGVNTFRSTVTYSGTVDYASTVGVYAPTKSGDGTINYNCALYAENTASDGIYNVAIYANGSSEFRSCTDARPVMKVAGYSATQSAGLINFYRDASGDIVATIDCSGTYKTSGSIASSGTISSSGSSYAKSFISNSGSLNIPLWGQMLSGDSNWAYGCYASGSEYWMQVRYSDSNDNKRGFRVFDASASSIVFYANSQNTYSNAVNGFASVNGFSVNGNSGWNGSFTALDGSTVTVSGGIITSVAP